MKKVISFSHVVLSKSMTDFGGVGSGSPIGLNPRVLPSAYRLVSNAGQRKEILVAVKLGVFGVLQTDPPTQRTIA